jgi:succinyl-diaminopimelate desuccinylase
MPSETTTAHSLLDLTQTLVRIPSCTGHDSPESVLEAIGGYLTTSGIENFQILRSDRGEPLAAWGLIECGRPGPTYLLNAPADTAPAGDVSTWLHSVLGGDVDGGWLYGRGSADSKAGIAVFCHVAREIRKLAATLRGRLLLVFDADEHSGGFEGIKRAVLLSGRRSGEAESPLAGAFIGYPGHDRVIVGCRGFFRAIVSVHGVAAHSGASKRQGVNAIARAVKLMEILDAQGKDSGKSGGLTDADFPLPPTVSVTAIHGGEGFSTVPDLCTLNIDCRLTPHADRAWADRRIAQAVATLDLEAPDVPRSQIERLEGWPAYRLAPDAPIVEALQLAARRVLGRTLPMDIAGPSSVGNYLATEHIAATSGFGVRHRNLHAADECIDVATLEPTFAVYLDAVQQLLN